MLKMFNYAMIVKTLSKIAKSVLKLAIALNILVYPTL